VCVCVEFIICTIYIKLHSTILHYTTSTTLHCTTLYYTALPQLHYTILHCTTSTALHCTTLYYTSLHQLHYTALPQLHYTIPELNARYPACAKPKKKMRNSTEKNMRSRHALRKVRERKESFLLNLRYLCV
jgi:hypothetical protein